jgi:hypothetical protein
MSTNYRKYLRFYWAYAISDFLPYVYPYVTDLIVCRGLLVP